MQQRCTFGSFRRCAIRCRCAVALMVLLGGAIALLAGCQSNDRPSPMATSPPPTFVGPRYLYGTVGSLTEFRGIEPMFVRGYGLVVNLEGTGSSEVPAELRQWFLTEMRKRGIPAATSILRDPRTAVVIVEGMIPPGAQKGTRFDVLVSAYPQTQTTSLAGGDLWPTELGPSAGLGQLAFVRTRAEARGPMYINPFMDQSLTVDRDNFLRQGVVLGGGITSEERRIDLALRQPSWTRSRQIADRINMRWPHNKATDVFNTAVAESDELIRLNVPSRFANRPGVFLDLIAHTFVQGGVGFEEAKASELGRELEKSTRSAASIELAWVTLGRNALPAIREFYDHENLDIQLTALSAGAKLEDGRTVEWLMAIAKHENPAIRTRIAGMLVHLPRSLVGVRVLRDLLSDEQREVRIAAYESLVGVNDPMIGRIPVNDGRNLKFMLDLVPSERPMVYVTQEGAPRLVIFNPMLGFSESTVGRLFSNRLMVRTGSGDTKATVYYQPSYEMSGKTVEIAPTVANFVRFLGHKANPNDRTEGLNLNYSQVVSAVYQLNQQGFIDAELEIRMNYLARAIAAEQERAAASGRPEVSDLGATDPGAADIGVESEDGIGDTAEVPAMLGTLFSDG